jgi:hypothetical protein
MHASRATKTFAHTSNRNSNVTAQLLLAIDGGAKIVSKTRPATTTTTMRPRIVTDRPTFAVIHHLLLSLL